MLNTSKGDHQGPIKTKNQHLKDQSMGFDGDYFNLVEPSMVTEDTADITVKKADNTVKKTQASVLSLKDLKSPPPGGKHSGGPLTPVDSPRAAIEKIIHGSNSPNRGDGVVRSQSGMELDGDEYNPLTGRNTNRMQTEMHYNE